MISPSPSSGSASFCASGPVCPPGRSGRVRRSSPTFGKWLGVFLSAANRTALWIPPGCAHGFYVLSDWADVVYKVTEHWSPEHERTLLWNDPELGVAWPVPEGVKPILSEKDAAGTRLRDAELY